MEGTIIPELSRRVEFSVPIWFGGPTTCMVEFKQEPGKLPDGGGPEYWYHIHIHGIYWGSFNSVAAANIRKATITHSLVTPREVTEKIIEITREVFSTPTRAE